MKSIQKQIGLVVIILLAGFDLANAQNLGAAYAWTKYPNKIQELDQLIQQSNQYALEPSDYNRHYLKSFLEAGLYLKNATDSATADSIIHKTALHFFGELAYGNHPPQLQYEGVNFKMDKASVDAKVKQYASTKSLSALVVFYNTQSPELISILKKLYQLQDSLPQSKNKVIILKRAANEYRWLREISKNQKIILVNIPSTQLHVYDGTKNPINMKVIVGKTKTPTNTLSSTLAQVIINPYWTVPKSIATKEMLPILKKDRSYIDRTHLQVLNENYRVVSPNNINWQNYDVDNFPFTIRQSTGCDNSLGVLKLDFDSPFGIYLHDTPEKALFENSSRFYSHGCMRMERPIEMGKWVLQNNRAALDTIDLSKCYKNPTPINIPVSQKIHVIVWYSLLDFDNNGRLHFFKDIYHKFSY